MFQLADYEKITRKAAHYAEKLEEIHFCELNQRDQRQHRANRISPTEKEGIRFLNGEFDYIYEKCQKEGYTLGWSSKFKGLAIPLFILLLNKDSRLTKAKEKLLDSFVFRLDFAGDKEEFLNLFLKWKEKQILTESQYKKYISWLDEEVYYRVKGLLEGSYRNSYYKAAFLLVSFGETLEANGMENARALTIDRYRGLYPRKSRFKKELMSLND